MPILLTVILAITVYALYRAFRPSGKGTEVQLLTLCLGDDALANRLIRREQELSPDIDRREAVRRAVLAMQRDRR